MLQKILFFLALSTTIVLASNMKCGAGKCGQAMKCGAGKCGSSMKMNGCKCTDCDNDKCAAKKDPKAACDCNHTKKMNKGASKCGTIRIDMH